MPVHILFFHIFIEKSARGLTCCFSKKNLEQVHTEKNNYIDANDSLATGHERGKNCSIRKI